jgi:acyl-CoA thioesterase I
MNHKSRSVSLFANPLGSLMWLVLMLLTLATPPISAESTKPAVVLVFGDSLSAAYRMNEAEGWVALLQERLNEHGKNIRVVNGSVSGETTAGGLARLPALLRSSNPDVVILELGGNDGLRGLPVPAMRSNLREMILMSRAAGAQVLLAGIQIPPNYGPRYTVPFYAQYRELADEFDLPLIPFLLDGIAEDSRLMQEDGIHPTAEAQPMIVDIVWPLLWPML